MKLVFTDIFICILKIVRELKVVENLGITVLKLQKLGFRDES